jgi:hypothetical protein
VYAPIPPLALIVWLYAVPNVPAVNTVGLAPFGDTVMTGQLMVIEYDALAGQPLESLARIVKLAVCAVVGVPVIAPVEPFNERPAGKLPLFTI